MRRHYANDRISRLRGLGILGLESPAEDSRITAEPRLPPGVADYQDIFNSRLALLRRQPAAERRLRVKKLEELGRDPAAPDMLEELLADELDRIGVVCSQLLERIPVPDQFLNEKRADATHPGVPEVDLVELDELLLVLAGNGVEQVRIHHAEDRGRRTDAQRQRERGHGGEAGILLQLAEGVAHVIHGSLNESQRY